MLSKEILAQNKTLLAWWAGVVGNSNFDQMMLILKSSAFEGSPNPDQISGITRFIDSMSSIINANEPPTTYASSGLKHDLEIHRRTVNPPAPKQPEQPKKKL